MVVMLAMALDEFPGYRLRAHNFYRLIKMTDRHFFIKKKFIRWGCRNAFLFLHDTANTCEAYSELCVSCIQDMHRVWRLSPLFNHAFSEVPTVGHFSFINYLFCRGREIKCVLNDYTYYCNYIVARTKLDEGCYIEMKTIGVGKLFVPIRDIYIDINYSVFFIVCGKINLR